MLTQHSPPHPSPDCLGAATVPRVCATSSTDLPPDPHTPFPSPAFRLGAHNTGTGWPSSPGSGRDVDGPLVLLSSVFVVRLMTCQAPAPRLCLLVLPIFWYLHSGASWGIWCLPRLCSKLPVGPAGCAVLHQGRMCGGGGSPVTLDREAERRAWGRWEGSARFLDVPIGSRETPPT